MLSWISLELTKLRRTSLLWVGVAAGLLAILVSFYLAAADRMTQYTVDIFMGNLIANNQSSLFPFVAVLTVGRMMEAERTGHTLPGVLTVPVRFSTLLAAKLATGVVLTAGYSAVQWALGVVCCVGLALPGVEALPLLGHLARLLANNLCLYAAVLPVTALTAQFAGGYVAGTVFAVFYSFCSIPLSGHGFAAFYPISAGSVLMGLAGPAPTAAQRLCAGISLGGTLLLGLLLTATARDRTKEHPARPDRPNGRAAQRPRRRAASR